MLNNRCNVKTSRNVERLISAEAQKSSSAKVEVEVESSVVLLPKFGECDRARYNAGELEVYTLLNLVTLKSSHWLTLFHFRMPIPKNTDTFITTTKEATWLHPISNAQLRKHFSTTFFAQEKSWQSLTFSAQVRVLRLNDTEVVHKKIMCSKDKLMCRLKLQKDNG